MPAQAGIQYTPRSAGIFERSRLLDHPLPACAGTSFADDDCGMGCFVADAPRNDEDG
jgi:hypothetical protein